MEKINIINPKEINSQKQSLFTSYRSNSLRYCKNKSSFNIQHRISFDHFGEKKKLYWWAKNVFDWFWFDVD